MKTCPNCGSEIPGGMKFCGECGTAYTPPEPAPVPVAVAESAVYTEPYDIFLSYRRNGGETMAILLRDRLVAKGYNVFLDIENLNSGSFNNKLLNVIDNCKDFLLICSENSLDRCNNDGDWVRLEIAHALSKGKNVIPVMLRGFAFPDALPADIEAIRMQNGVNANSHEYFDAAIDRLAEKFLNSTPAGNTPAGNKPAGVTTAATPQPQQPGTSQEDNYKKLFVDSDEQHVCTLGNAHLQKYFREKSLNNAFSVVSDRSVYFRGTSYDINDKCRKKTVSQAAPLKDVTGVNAAKHKIPFFLTMGIVIAAVGLLLSIVGVYNVYDFGITEYESLLLPIGILILCTGVYFLIRYAKETELLTVSFNGGTVSFEMKWFPAVEADNYQKELRLAIDKAKR